MITYERDGNRKWCPSDQPHSSDERQLTHGEAQWTREYVTANAHRPEATYLHVSSTFLRLRLMRIEPSERAPHICSPFLTLTRGSTRHYPSLLTLVCPIMCQTSSHRRARLSNSTSVSRLPPLTYRGPTPFHHLLSPSPKQTHLQVSRDAIAPPLPSHLNTPPC